MPYRLLPILVLSLAWTAACSDTDVSVDDDAGLPERVPLDLEPYLQDAPDPSGAARVFEATDPSELVEGVAATGQVGDYVLENDRVRFVVEADRRRMNGCPWGGNIIDAASRSPEFGGDILGEICIFLNADQTFKPERYEILRDGSDGGAVLAVTGRTEVLDFLNLTSMMGLLFPGLSDLFQLRPDGLLPLTLTQYFIMRPGDQGVRVVTRMRNDGEAHLSLVLIHLLLSGGDGIYFNPLGEMGGFGYEPTGLASIDADPLPYLGVMSDTSGVAFVPQPDAALEADLPISGGSVTLFNVVATLLGRTEVLETLLANPDNLPDMPGVLQLEPGEIGETDYWALASDGRPSTMLDVAYDALDVATARVEGVVQDPAGAPVERARVSAVDAEGRTMNQTLTDGDGGYAMDVPEGTYTLSARLPGRVTPSPPPVTVAAGESAPVDDILLEEPGAVRVRVRTPDDEPTPARVSLLCDGACPHKPTPNEWDVTFDQLPEHFADVAWAGTDGEVTFQVPPGDYRVVVSRGMEWSVWPEDAQEAGGVPIQVVAGEVDPEPVEAEIARVVGSNGALAADFHVHSLSSMDSTTPHQDRVLTFLTEGVDVIVSTEHDVMADYAPAIQTLQAQDHITSLVGTEITTSDLGHFNGFPTSLDATRPNGGALDWGNGAGPALSLDGIFDWVRSHPGEQVVQVNHPDISFFVFSDVLRGRVFGDPDIMRVQASDPDPDTGDIGLWSEGFTAMEVMNGHDMESYWGVLRWWLTLVGRGQTPTATGVTDTHRRYGDALGAVPRTYVFVDEDHDSAATFDTAHFVEAVNARRAVVTTGPFVRVEATNALGDTAGVGEVLETGHDGATFQVTIEVPEWVSVDAVDVVINSEEVVTAPREYNTTPFLPTESHEVQLEAADLEEVFPGHRRYRTTLEIPVETSEDTYVVFIVRGSDDMAPVVPWPSVEPFAVTNPVFLDADGGGYDNPPLADLAASEPTSASLHHLEHETAARPLTREVLLEHIREARVRDCGH